MDAIVNGLNGKRLEQFEVKEILENEYDIITKELALYQEKIVNMSFKGLLLVDLSTFKDSIVDGSEILDALIVELNKQQEILSTLLILDDFSKWDKQEKLSDFALEGINELKQLFKKEDNFRKKIFEHSNIFSSKLFELNPVIKEIFKQINQDLSTNDYELKMFLLWSLWQSFFEVKQDKIELPNRHDLLRKLIIAFDKYDKPVFKKLEKEYQQILVESQGISGGDFSFGWPSDIKPYFTKKVNNSIDQDYQDHLSKATNIIYQEYLQGIAYSFGQARLKMTAIVTDKSIATALDVKQRQELIAAMRDSNIKTPELVQEFLRDYLMLDEVIIKEKISTFLNDHYKHDLFVDLTPIICKKIKKVMPSYKKLFYTLKQPSLIKKVKKRILADSKSKGKFVLSEIKGSIDNRMKEEVKKWFESHVPYVIELFTADDPISYLLNSKRLLIGETDVLLWALLDGTATFIVLLKLLSLIVVNKNVMISDDSFKNLWDDFYKEITTDDTISKRFK